MSRVTRGDVFFRRKAFASFDADFNEGERRDNGLEHKALTALYFYLIASM